jgi:hypothetical protein
MFRACRSVGEGLMALNERRTELEFSRTVEANDVGREGLELAFEASAGEREGWSDSRCRRGFAWPPATGSARK